ncbi:MAG TPA: hemolysin family protein [Vicinamibacteria bacterium]|nr:hemolysin family protein [Vicinamibacteria bacterium]
MSGDGFALEVTLVAVLILLNGFFAGAEIAVISARRARIRPRAEAGQRAAQALLRLKSDPDRFLATVQIGVTLVGTLASAVGGVAAVERLEPLLASLPLPWMRELAEPLAVGLVVFLIAFLSLVVGELVPKSLAVRHAETLGLLVARPIERLERFAGLAVTTLTAATGIVLRLLGQRGETHSPFHSVEDIRAILDEADRQGMLDGQVVKGAVAFQDYEARQLMTPRSRVVGLPRGSSIEAALRIARDSGYSRLPVYADDLDTIDGIVYARDLYEARQRGRPSDIAPLVRPALLVPETLKARELLAAMRRERRHLAMVFDDHGAVDGLVTLEDVFEAIVGDIRDEHDDSEPPVRALGDDVIEVDGGVAVRELNARFGLSLPESPRYASVAGLLLERLGSVPMGGESVEVEIYRIGVAAMAGRRIARVRIEPIRAAQPASA